jgi:hypothetical protein
MDQSSELGHLRKEVGRKVDDLLKKRLAVNVQMAAFFRRRSKTSQGIVGARVVKCL